MRHSGRSFGSALTSFARSYPAKVDEHHHKTIAYLPREVALALSDSPGLAAEAIGAFYERDPDGLRVRSSNTCPY